MYITIHQHHNGSETEETKGTCYEEWSMLQYQERDGKEDRKQGGNKCNMGSVGQNKVEKLYSIPFRRPQMMRKA